MGIRYGLEERERDTLADFIVPERVVSHKFGVQLTDWRVPFQMLVHHSRSSPISISWEIIFRRILENSAS